MAQEYKKNHQTTNLKRMSTGKIDSEHENVSDNQQKWMFCGSQKQLSQY